MALNKVLNGMLKKFKEDHLLKDVDDSKAFEYFVNYLIISKYISEKISTISDIEGVVVDEKSQFGLDAIAFIVNGNLVLNKEDIKDYADKSHALRVEIIFIQSKIEEKCDTGDLLKTIEATKRFLKDSDATEKNDNLLNAVEIYNALFEYSIYSLCRDNTPKCHIFYITAAQTWDKNLVSDICKRSEEEIKSLNPDIKDVEISVFGKDYVMDEYNENQNKVSASINLKNCVVIDPKIQGVNEAYIGYVSGEDYLKIICDNSGDIRRRIFYENVRDYQGVDNSVNSEIRETISNDSSRARFVLLNNGVTIITKSAVPQGSNQYEISDFQIVNGCQTSNEIYNCKEYAKNLLIPVKIIYTTDLDLINSIVRSTNRQSPVPEEAFITMNKFHKELQMLIAEYAKEMPIGIFYERRSGEASEVRGKLRDFQIVTLHGIIRAFVSVYLRKPYIVYQKNPANILNSDNIQLFEKNHSPDLYFISSYLFVQLVMLEQNGILSRHDYSYRFYIIMIVRMLMVKSVGKIDLNAENKALKSEVSNLVAILKSDKVGTYYTQAKEIVERCLSSPEYKDKRQRDILKTLGFNDKVLEAVKSHIARKK